MTDLPDYAKTKPKLQRQLVFEGAWPTSVAFIDDGKRLAAGNQAGQIVIWDLTAGKDRDIKPTGDRTAPDLAPSRQLLGHTNGVTRLVPAPDGRTLYSASLDHTIRAWDLSAPATGNAELVLDADTREREAKKGGANKAAGRPAARVETQEAAAVLEGHRDWVSTLALSPDGKRLLTGDFAAEIVVWDAASASIVGRWSGIAWNWIVAGAWLPDGRTALVSECRDKRDDFDVPSPALRLWNVDERSVKLDLLKVQFPKYDPQASTYEAAQVWRKFTAAGLIAAAVSPDGKLLAVGQGGETDTGKVHLLDSSTGKLLRTVSGHRYGVTDVCFSGDGRYVLSVGRDTTLRICATTDGKEVAALGSPRGGQFKDWLSALAVSPDGRTLAAADIAGSVHVWTV